MLTIHGKPAPFIDDGDRVVSMISFDERSPNTRHQAGDWGGAGLHWTGGEGGPERVVRVLRNSRLSVHFITDTDGTIYQTADLSVICAHIGIGNPRFWGNEVVCRGFWSDADRKLADQQSLRERTEIDWSTPRDLYKSRQLAGGRLVRYAALNPKQIEAIVWLTTTVNSILGEMQGVPIPRRIPWQSHATLAAAARVFDSVSEPEKWVVEHEGKFWSPSYARDVRRHNRALWATHAGALGHFHLHKDKHDPGPQAMLALWAEGYNPAGRVLHGLMPLGIAPLRD